VLGGPDDRGGSPVAARHRPSHTHPPAPAGRRGCAPRAVPPHLLRRRLLCQLQAEGAAAQQRAEKEPSYAARREDGHPQTNVYGLRPRDGRGNRIDHGVDQVESLGPAAGSGGGVEEARSKATAGAGARDGAGAAARGGPALGSAVLPLAIGGGAGRARGCARAVRTSSCRCGGGRAGGRARRWRRRGRGPRGSRPGGRPARPPGSWARKTRSCRPCEWLSTTRPRLHGLECSRRSARLPVRPRFRELSACNPHAAPYGVRVVSLSLSLHAIGAARQHCSCAARACFAPRPTLRGPAIGHRLCQLPVGGVHLCPPRPGAAARAGGSAAGGVPVAVLGGMAEGYSCFDGRTHGCGRMASGRGARGIELVSVGRLFTCRGY
jgi:hypothetical protein